MSIVKIAFKNGIVGFIADVTYMFLSFAIRMIVVHYIGIEILGVNETIVSFLNLINIIEGGIKSSLIFRLYKPIEENDFDKVNFYVNTIRIVYKYIGYLFILLSILFIPVIPFILSNIEFNNQIYLIYIMQVMILSSIFFNTYKRIFLFAAKMEYFYKQLDTLFLLFSNLLGILILIFTKNYMFFLIIKLFATYISNILINQKSNEVFQYYKKIEISFNEIIFIWNDYKHLLVGNLANYVYNGSDSLIISIFLGTVNVAYLSNYGIIFSQLKQIISSIFNISNSIIGASFIKLEHSNDKNIKLLTILNHLWYYSALITIVPICFLVNKLIIIWMGEDYLLSSYVIAFIIIDYYIYLIQSPLGNFLIATGNFNFSKINDITGAIINIILSILLINKYGIEGVLFATVFSRIIQWIIRSYIVIFKVLKKNKIQFLNYWLRNVIYIVILLIILFLAKIIFGGFVIDNKYIEFIVLGILYLLFTIFISFPILSYFVEHKIVVSMIMKNISNKNKITV